ncbi:MAG: malto-oligosyltrehalose trehalohydrolase, partial [Syntrophothermus sp.]
MKTKSARRYPAGAEMLEEHNVSFRIWAPGKRKVELAIRQNSGRLSDYIFHTLNEERGGYFSIELSNIQEGTLYMYKLDGGDSLYPDPASRFQPEGTHGPSMVVNPHKYKWKDNKWSGVKLSGQVIYEMHLGTFTPEGTVQAAMKELPELADTGITVIEVMPIAEFSGRYGWGYDGVDLFAPYHYYGTPDEYRSFIDHAHSLGIGVILDVVYNHLGPDGNYLGAFSKDYFSQKYDNEWGEAINFDGKNSGAVREFFLSNAAYWIDEYHFDGLRLDATQQIFDSSEKNIIAEISRAVRSAAGGKSTFIVAENEPQNVKLVQPEDKGGYGLECLWNDDLHHTAYVSAVSHNEAYYTDYHGSPQEFISAFKYGYLYQGQWYSWQKNRRGTPAFGIEPARFVTFTQNHDQIANSGRGERLHKITSPGRFKALTALFLLSPGTPMLFQGQEFASSSPFFYFADHNQELTEKIKEGRTEFLAQFPSLATPEMQKCLPDPAEESTFKSCILDM